MTPLADPFFALAAGQRRIVHDRLTEHALAKWRAHAEREGEIRYHETVCGTEQSVDLRLPEDALAAVRSGQGIEAVAARYGEPMAALQDQDLTFPEPVRFAYYAIYNFFRRYALEEDVDDWLLVSQALSTEEDAAEGMALLTRAIKQAT